MEVKGFYFIMRLVDYLQLKNMNKAQFARLIGISRMHMSNICNKRRVPSLLLARRIIEATDGKVNVADLFEPDSQVRIFIEENSNEKN